MLAVIAALFLPRLPALDAYATGDEPFWLTRSANFYCALSQGDFAHTYQREHPGVITMWAGTLGFLWRAPGYAEGCSATLIPAEHETVFEARGIVPREMLAAGRLFAVLLQGLVLGVALLLAWRLLGPLPAVLGLLLVAFDPFHLALSRVLHLDGLLSSFVFLSLLAFTLYLRERRALDLLISGAAAGLAWLTKSPGFFLIPFAGLLMVLDLGRWYLRGRSGGWARKLWRSARTLLLWGLVGALVFFLLWPAMWVEPVATLSKIFGSAAHYASEGHGRQVFFAGDLIEDGDVGWEHWYFYPVTYLWRSTPAVLLGLLLAVSLYLLRRRAFDRSGGWPLIVPLLFALTYTLAMTVGGKKFDRYLLPIYPPLDLLAGAGWAALLRVLLPERRLPLRALVAGAVTVAQIAVAMPFRPSYFPYFNPLLGGPQKALGVMMVGRGEGLEQAADYLNRLPGAEGMTVFSWYNMGSFSYFFNGRSEHLPSDYRWSAEQVEAVFSADYVVTYVLQRQRNLPWQLQDYLAHQHPVHTVQIHGVDYVEIYRLRPERELAGEAGYRATDLQLDERIRLTGYTLPTRPCIAGEPAPVAFVWEALETPGASYKVFLHLFDAQGQLVSQVDAEPVSWFRPTGSWAAGDRWVDRYHLPLPEALPPGEYTLRVGMYHPATGERLPVTQGGTPVGDGYIVGTLIVEGSPNGNPQ